MSAKRLISLTCVLGLATVIFAEEQQSDVPARSSTIGSKQSRTTVTSEHLRQAAEQVEATIGAMKNSHAEKAWSVEEIDELSRPIAEVQKQLDQLRDLTGHLEQRLFHFRVLEVPADAAAELTAVDSQPPSVFGPTRTVFKNTEELNKRLAAIDGVKRISEPQIVTLPGHPASVLTGGEFPIQLPGKDNSTNIEWREFGTRFEMVFHPIDAGRIRVEFAAEVSERDMSTAIKVGEQMVPGLTSRRANTQAEMNLGETLAVTLPMMPNRTTATDGAEPEKAMTTLFLLTPTPVDASSGK